jgi:N-carbamoyl-L-amino-acid hydrolase
MTMKHALVLAAMLAMTNPAAAQGDPPLVDGDRLNRTMEEMKAFGGNADGGSDRVAFSSHNREALNYLAGLMQRAGMSTRIDVAGNLIGRLEGGRGGAATLLAGSHIDTVPNGGHYDGIVGVMSAIEVARTLHDLDIRLEHPLEIAVWTNEEGGKTGSRSMNGSVAASEMALPSLGDKTLGDGIRFLGGDPERLDENRLNDGAVAAYVELHVEQGAILDRERIDIGIVEGIVGIKRWYITVDGFANHAGTTPMDQRQDALLGAARLVVAVREIITAAPGRQVGTVGKLVPEPGAPNVIPGKVDMSLEIRDLDMDKIDALFARIEDAASRIGEDTGTSIAFSQYYESPAADSDERIMDVTEQVAADLGLSTLRMPSGAGHDAQSFKDLAVLGMIFVPSRDGISHAPGEYTSPTQITNGANVLLRTLTELDRRLD